MHMFNLEWDEDKRRRTLEDRGIDFAEMARFDWQTALVEQDLRHDYGEPRLRAFGMIDGRLHAAVLTPRGERIRLISLRRANEREQRRWRRSTS